MGEAQQTHPFIFFIVILTLGNWGFDRVKWVVVDRVGIKKGGSVMDSGLWLLMGLWCRRECIFFGRGVCSVMDILVWDPVVVANSTKGPKVYILKL